MSKWLTDNHLPRVTWWKVKVKVKSLSHVQLFVTPWTVACQVPLSIGFFQARVLEWVAISFSKRSSRPRDWIRVSRIVQFSSVAQSCRTLCDPMNHSMPGLPVHHQLPESTQTYVHCWWCHPTRQTLYHLSHQGSLMVNSNPISWLLAGLPQHSSNLWKISPNSKVWLLLPYSSNTEAILREWSPALNSIWGCGESSRQVLFLWA